MTKKLLMKNSMALPARALISLAMIILLAGCEELRQIASQPGAHRPLTNQEVINGLRQALVIGSDSAAAKLSAINGYYLNEDLRIELPPEAGVITSNLSYIPGGQQMVDDIVLRINRAAEDAAREAAPVFAVAVSNLTIRDGFDILRGEDDAATQYLKSQTREELYKLYQPRIQRSLDREIVGNVSTNEAWNTLTSRWNSLASSTAGQLASLNTVDTELDSFLTDRALDGLFLKLAEEEANIRNNSEARVTDLLQRVFGQDTYRVSKP